MFVIQNSKGEYFGGRMKMSGDIYKIPNDAKTGTLTYKAPPAKTISQICIEADENKTEAYKLILLWNSVVEKKHQYSPSHLRFMHEHIQNYIVEINDRAKSQKYFEE